MTVRRTALLVASLLTCPPASSIIAAEFLPTKSIIVSDESDRDALNTIDAGPLDDNDPLVVRERATLTQDALQIRTFLEFDLSALTAAEVANPGFLAVFSIDYSVRLNTVNSMSYLFGRVQADGVAGDAWDVTPGSFPLYEWGGENAADGVVFLEDSRTFPEGGPNDFDDINTTADVTQIVRDWVNGVHVNNGAVLYGSGDIFQGAGFNDAKLITFVQGDVNGDDSVDLADFEIIRMNFGNVVVAREEGDLNFDGTVDFGDFREWKNNRVLGAAATQAVPEPGAAAILLLLVTTPLVGGWGRAYRR